MQSVLYFLSCLLLTTSLSAQIDLTPAEWQEDLRFLQHTVHQDYDFLFDKVTAEDFDAEVEKLHAAIPELADHEVIVGLARIVSLFGYGHTNIWLTGWDPDNPYGFRQMPYNLYAFADGVYVQGAHRDYAQAVGARVTHVAGVPVDEALAAIRPVVPVENEQYFKAFGIQYLGTPAVLHAQGVTPTLQENVTLTLEKEGKTFEQAFAPVAITGHPVRYSLLHEDENWVDARDNSTTPLWLQHLDRIYYYEYLPESKTVYVRHSQIQDDSTQAIPEFYEEVFQFVDNNDVDRLVLDVRLNGGGNNYKNKPIVTGIIRSEKINESGKFFVILGRRTYSACQNLVNELHNYTNAIFVGEPTAENINFYGDNRRVELPHSKIDARLSFAWWQDKPQWENDDWLAPQLAVDMTFADYRQNVDPALDAILNYSGEKIILDPMTYLADLFNAGKIAEVQAEAKRLVAHPHYRYYPFEDRFNRTGYNLLGGGRHQEAVYVFEMTAQLFPDSPNAWDSLAEGHWRAGNVAKAIEYYEKAIALDPTGPTGKNAREMLIQMRDQRE